MKTNTANNRAFRYAAALGLTALFAGLMAQSPARADDDWRFHRYRNDAHFDVVAIHHDEDRLHDLYRRRNSLRDRRDWRGVEELDVQIGGVRFHLDNDRYDARRDFDRDRYFHAPTEYRPRDFDRRDNGYRDYDRDHDYYRDGYRIRDGR